MPALIAILAAVAAGFLASRLLPPRWAAPDRSGRTSASAAVLAGFATLALLPSATGAAQVPLTIALAALTASGAHAARWPRPTTPVRSATLRPEPAADLTGPSRAALAGTTLLVLTLLLSAWWAPDGVVLRTAADVTGRGWDAVGLADAAGILATLAVLVVAAILVRRVAERIPRTDNATGALDRMLMRRRTHSAVAAACFASTAVTLFLLARAVLRATQDLRVLASATGAPFPDAPWDWTQNAAFLLAGLALAAIVTACAILLRGPALREVLEAGRSAS